MALRAARVSDSTAAAWLVDLAKRTTHLSVMNGRTFAVSDPLTLEPAGSVYARARVTWRIAGRLITNVNPLVWVGIPSDFDVVDLAGWDAGINGRVTVAVPAPADLSFEEVSSGGLIIPAGDFFFGLDL